MSFSSPQLISAAQLKEIHGGHGVLEYAHIIIGTIELFNYVAGHLVNGPEGIPEDDYLAKLVYGTYLQVTNTVKCAYYRIAG